jgi:hypothetical protein
MANYDAAAFYAKIADDMGQAQTAGGLVPDIAPEYVVFQRGFRDSPEWGSAFIIAPWLAYQRYGDRRVLERHYDGMVRYAGTWAAKRRVISFHTGWATGATSVPVHPASHSKRPRASLGRPSTTGTCVFSLMLPVCWDGGTRQCVTKCWPRMSVEPSTGASTTALPPVTPAEARLPMLCRWCWAWPNRRGAASWLRTWPAMCAGAVIRSRAATSATAFCCVRWPKTGAPTWSIEWYPRPAPRLRLPDRARSYIAHRGLGRQSETLAEPLYARPRRGVVL